MAALTAGYLAILVMVAATLALALALPLLSPRRRDVQVFALFLGFRAVLNLTNLARALLEEPAADAYWSRVAPYFIIPLPFLAVLFALLHPRPRGLVRGVPVPALAVALAALVCEAAYALDHALFQTLAVGSGGAGAGILGPLQATLGLLLPAYGAVALVFALEALRDAQPGRRGTLLLMSLGFGLDALFLGLLLVLRGAAGLLPVGQAPAEAFLGTPLLWPLALVPLAAAGVLVARARARSGDAEARRALGRYLLALLAAALTAVATFAGYVADPSAGLVMHQLLDSLWTLLLPALVAYGLLRYRLFDIDLRVKGTIRQGTIAGAFVGAFVLGSEAGRPLLGDLAAPYAGLLAAGLLLLAARQRVQRLGARVADLALPGAEDSPRYLQARKLEVYRAALEQALAGRAAPGEREGAMLASLRQELGLSQEEHARVELAVRTAGAVAVRPDPVQGELMLGRYRVLHKLGAGAHGTTFLAEDQASGARLALKVLRPELAAEGTLREARALQEVRHPHVVALRDVVEAGGQAYLLTEFVEGGSLAERLRRGPLEAGEFRRVALGLLEGLAAVHAAGLVHRDVKPANVLLGSDGQPRLADFGVAHVPGAETTLGGKGSEGAVGTVRYMSPEQAKGRKVTPRSDLFSAAATLYEAWTGQPYLKPRPGESPVELQMRAASQDVFRAPLPRASPALRAWFARALHPDPSRRFPAAGAMGAALEKALGPPKAGRRP